MIDVRTLGTKVDDLECDDCERQSNDLAVYDHPHNHRRVILCVPCAEVVFKDELADAGPDEEATCPACLGEGGSWHITAIPGRDYLICPSCGGKGKVTAPDEPDEPDESTCDSCGITAPLEHDRSWKGWGGELCEECRVAWHDKDRGEDALRDEAAGR